LTDDLQAGKSLLGQPEPGSEPLRLIEAQYVIKAVKEVTDSQDKFRIWSCPIRG